MRNAIPAVTSLAALAALAAFAPRAGAEPAASGVYSLQVVNATEEPLTRLRYCGTRHCAVVQGPIAIDESRGVAVPREHGPRIVLSGWRGDRQVSQRAVELEEGILNRVTLRADDPR